MSFNAEADVEIVLSGVKKTQTIDVTDEVKELLEVSNYFVVVKAKQFGGSHYAYTDALAEMMNNSDLYHETNFNAGSQMVLVSIMDKKNGQADVFETVLLESKQGVIRDPDVSTDGERILFLCDPFPRARHFQGSQGNSPSDGGYLCGYPYRLRNSALPPLRSKVCHLYG